MNCADSVVLAQPFQAVATFLVCSSILSCWANRTPSQPCFSTFLHSCRGSWLFARDTHCLLSPLSMLTFPLSSFLICDLTISSTRRRRYRHLQLFFFCCQLGYFSIHITNAFTPATSIKLRNSFKHQHLVDLIQVHSFTSRSGTICVTYHTFDNSKALLLLPWSISLASVCLHVVGIKILCISSNPYFDPILYWFGFYEHVKWTLSVNITNCSSIVTCSFGVCVPFEICC